MSAELRDIAVTVALEARDLVVKGRAAARVTTTKSSDADIVTQMDTAAEELIRARLAELRPGDGVLGEEGDTTESSTGITWVVDPIDGTVNYLYGLPYFAVSIAAVSGTPTTGEWTSEAAAVAAGTGTVWAAARGLGATRDGEVIRRDSVPDLSTTLVGTGFGYVAERREAQAATVARLIGSVRDIRRIGSAAIDLCMTGDGTLDAYYERGLNAWDLAAGVLVASEAGMRVGNLSGGAPDEGITVVAGDRVWDAFTGLLTSAGADLPW